MKGKALLLALIVLMLVSAGVQAAATRDDALAAIGQAKLDMQEMSNAGFAVLAVNDTVTAAEQALERADFAELLRKNATGELAKEARKALEGLNYEGFSYDSVLVYTGGIASRKAKAFELSDSLRALELKIEGYRKQGVKTADAETLYASALDAFGKERYTEAESLLSDANTELDERRAEITTLNAILDAGRGFAEKNWSWILLAVAVILVASWAGWRRYKIRRIRRQLKKLRTEENVLIGLMKKAQMERYKSGKLSESIFNIRMGKYTRRLNEIKETIPVYEGMLNPKKKTAKK